jgi:hypothetical protein
MSRRIVAKLFGGLGNQMFIYTVAKVLSLKNRSDLYFDVVSGFQEDKKYRRGFLLDAFNIKYNQVSHIYCFNYLGGRFVRKISRFLGVVIPMIKMKFYSEPQPYRYQPDLLVIASRNSLFLEGYFQSYKYFRDVWQDIADDFTFKDKYINDVVGSDKYIGIISNFRSVAVGIRRYQEVNPEELNILGGLVEIDYYIKAMDYMVEEIGNPTFFIFSQDINWAKEMLPADKYNLVFISDKKGDSGAIEDLYLFSLCKHQIISNSTFYWWGAWLNKNVQKKVYAPNNFINSDCIPSDWTIVHI